MIDSKGSWEDHLHLAEFFYNNNYQASIKMAPSEALYEKKCRSSLCWDEVGEGRHLGLEVIIHGQGQIIQEHLLQHRTGRRVW